MSRMWILSCFRWTRNDLVILYSKRRSKKRLYLLASVLPFDCVAANMFLSSSCITVFLSRKVAGLGSDVSAILVVIGVYGLFTGRWHGYFDIGHFFRFFRIHVASSRHHHY